MRSAFLSLFLLAAAGCGKSDVPPLGQVTGTVTLDGKPVANAEVTFQPTAGGRGSIGMTDASGLYRLDYLYREPGALVGAHRVFISTARRANKDENQGEVAEGIPKAYNEQSILTANVTTGANTVDLPLDSKARAPAVAEKRPEPAH